MIDMPQNPQHRNMKEWSSIGIKSYLMLMLEFLRISPSYELARKERNEGLSAEDRLTLPNDFYEVLKTYDEFGDVAKIPFETWWTTTGIYIYGSEHEKPRVRRIATLEKDAEMDENFQSALERYFSLSRPREGNNPALILSVPLGINKRTVLIHISKLIDQTQVPIPVRAKKAARPLDAVRLRKPPLIRAISLLWFKAAKPKFSLWKLGVLAKVSPKHMEGLDISIKKQNSDTTDQRIKMAILTSRALKKAMFITENAARGKFPSSNPIKLPEFNWSEVNKRAIESRKLGKNRKVVSKSSV